MRICFYTDVLIQQISGKIIIFFTNSGVIFALTLYFAFYTTTPALIKLIIVYGFETLYKFKINSGIKV